MRNKYDSKVVIPFDEVTTETPGIAYKAGLQDADQDENGLGSVGTETNSSYDYSLGGAKKSSTEDTGQLQIILPSSTDAETALRNRLAGRGTVQIDLYVPDLTSRDDVTNKRILRTGINASSFPGPEIYFQYDSPAIGTAYWEMVAGSDGTVNVTNPVALRQSNTGGSADGFNPIGVVFDEVSSDWMTYTISYSGRFAEIWHDGKPIGVYPRKNYDFTVFDRIRLQETFACRMRNLLVSDRPRPSMFRRDASIRVVMAGHSFTAREPVRTFDLIGAPGSTYGYGSIYSLFTELYQRVPFDFAYDNVGISGSDLENEWDGWMDRGSSQAYTFDPASTGAVYYDRVLRHRPHFCIMLGVGNDSNASVVDTYVQSINAKLVAAGVIPIWVAEQNRNQAATDISGLTDQLVTTVAADRLTHGDIGLADPRAAVFGGDTVDASYVEWHASAVHPNWKAQPVYAEYITAEMVRLRASPPKYSRLYQESL